MNRTMRRWSAAVAVLLVMPSLAVVVTGSNRPAVAEETSFDPDTLTESAITVKGRRGVYDDFSGLEVTVSQTRDLTNQAVSIKWKGGTPTRAGLGVDFLQIMQCWGADPTVLDFRETCQFGAGVAAPTFGTGTPASIANRRVALPITPNPRDPAETLPADAQDVPFRTPAGERTPHGGAAEPFPDQTQDFEKDVLAKHYNLFTTNEIPYAITTGDGTGRAIFEVQDGTQAPQLGCGVVVGGQARPCWLVIVPRGHHNQYSGTDVRATGSVNGSPLTPALWANRIVVKIEFEPIGGFCQFGAAQRSTAGTQLVADAMISWQRGLCAGGGAVFGYVDTPDSEASRRVRSGAPGAPGLGFTADPVVTTDGGPPVVQAPVAISAMVIGFNIDMRVSGGAPADQALNATPVTDLKLTQRLVAKLLSQSYQRDVPGGQEGDVEYVKDNPRVLREDKEFLALNPIFAKYDTSFRRFDGLMVGFGNYSAAREVWRWILADPEAKEWLSGKPDEWGMKVNPNYTYIATGAPESFPKADQSCRMGIPNTPASEFCTPDLRPYLDKLDKAAQQTLRADAKSKFVFDPNRAPPAFVATEPTAPGQRFAMSVTDSASAARYGLLTASLRNRAGQFVKPGVGSLLNGVGAMVETEVPGVLAIDPGTLAPNAYPLTMVTYAVADLTQPEPARREYAGLLRYAVDGGQIPGEKPGQLPAGYVPLPDRLRSQTRSAAAVLEAGAPSAPATTDGSGGTTTPTSTLPPTAAGSTVPDGGAPPVSAGPSSSTSAPARVAQVTPGDAVGIIRYALLGVLLLGLLGAISGPVLLRTSTGWKRAPSGGSSGGNVGET